MLYPLGYVDINWDPRRHTRFCLVYALYIERTRSSLAYDHMSTFVRNIYHNIKVCKNVSGCFNRWYVGLVGYFVVQCLYHYCHLLKFPLAMKIWQLTTGTAGRKLKGLFIQCDWKSFLFWTWSILDLVRLDEAPYLTPVLFFCVLYYLFIYIFVGLFIHLFICWFIHLFICLFIYLFIYLLVYLVIYLFIYSFTHLLIYLFSYFF